MVGQVSANIFEECPLQFTKPVIGIIRRGLKESTAKFINGEFCAIRGKNRIAIRQGRNFTEVNSIPLHPLEEVTSEL